MFRNFIPKLIKIPNPFLNTPWHTFLHPPTIRHLVDCVCVCLSDGGVTFFEFISCRRFPFLELGNGSEAKICLSLIKVALGIEGQEKRTLRVCGVWKWRGRVEQMLAQNWHFTVLRSSADKRKGFHTFAPQRLLSIYRRYKVTGSEYLIAETRLDISSLNSCWEMYSQKARFAIIIGYSL